MIRRPSIFLCTFLFSIGLHSQSIDSTLHSGNWTDPGIWSQGVTPLPTDYVIINHNVQLDVNISLASPGKLFISITGELCGHYDFTGCFIHYGSFKVNHIHATYDTSFSYSQYMTANGCTVSGSGTVWHTSFPGYGCCGCPFTCNPIIPWQPPIADFGNSATICEGKTIQFYDMSANYPSSWSWYFSGGTPSVSSLQNPVIAYYQPGIYNVTLIAVNSIGSDTITKTNYILVIPSPTVTVSPDVTINYGDSIILTASGGGPYLWNTGDTSSCILIHPSATTTYNVSVTSANGCSDSNYVTVSVEPCPALYIPNAFSPNEDSENDFLKLYNSNQQCVKEITIQIFNRWGEKVFESSDQNFQWDGTFHSRSLDPGVFIYHLTIKMFDDKVISKEGNISLVR